MHLYGKKRFSNTHVFEHMFFLCKAMPFRLHINFYYHRVCKRNIIYNWKQLSFKFLYKWWVSGFCKLWNRSQMGFSYWWSICNNFTWTYFNLWQEYLCLICNVRESARERKKERERDTHTERDRQTERKRERQRRRQRQRKEITSSRRTSTGKVLSFLEILSLFPYEMFPWIKLFIPDEKLFLPKILPNKHFFGRYLKAFKNDFPLRKSSND